MDRARTGENPLREHINHNTTDNNSNNLQLPGRGRGESQGQAQGQEVEVGPEEEPDPKKRSAPETMSGVPRAPSEPITPHS